MKARLTLKVRAGASQTKFNGLQGDAWKLQVAAPPVDGKANEAIIRFLAKFARVPAAEVRIVTGHTSSTKIVEIGQIDPASLHRAILEANGPATDTGSSPTRKA
jgi:uncharacterized protein (TIGR00251 family)